MKLLVFLLSFTLYAHDEVNHHYDRNYTPAYYQLAYGQLSQKDFYETYPWSFPVLSIGHSIASFQG